MAGLWATGLTIVHPLDLPEDQGPGPSCPWRWRAPSEGGREGMAPAVSQCAGGEEAEPPSLGAQHSALWLCLGDCPPDPSKHSWPLTGPMKG